ncbi:sensor histidine kinase RegB [Actibacterium sp. XHP0104]|uniref:sensor histidine kinase RegB n=1 Tax=Actibacterium sp. XHP0104 TaxID=2984335 RepID=UPI0021E86E2C|nr:ActS/PrrB/RegB family redox-sensitive histidine kinase [Actibacterium sp. XHP0104]MCV2882125.1 ActS/PrrB/RegB family redox-sensitive histidine kinase [Actibacterium sp. XHP0104]
MTESSAIGLLAPGERSQWIRLRTLIWLRWVAITGQIVALGAAYAQFGLRPPLGPVCAVIGAAMIVNLAAIFVYPPNTRLTRRGALKTLLFDLVQLSALLFLTGGLNNPFALLVLTPVVISAMALGQRCTLILATSAGVLITVMMFVFLPLENARGVEQNLPDIFRFGFWAAIVIGVAFLSVYANRVTSEINSMADALLATQMALAREQKLTDLGGVVAAYAHELGTPLATITLVSSELAEELSDDPDLRDDAQLIRQQADRCRDILRSMGRAGKDDLHMHSAPLSAVVTEAAEPHQSRGKTVIIEDAPANSGTRQPVIARRPEIIHGLRNLVQNAVDFAASTVWVEMQWSDHHIGVRVMDDGPGYAPQVLERIGDPFMRKRADTRPGYEGMGLGLFIAKTLLERTGAELSFANGRDPAHARPGDPGPTGAVVEVIWTRSDIAASGPDTAENLPMTP